MAMLIALIHVGASLGWSGGPGGDAVGMGAGSFPMPSSTGSLAGWSLRFGAMQPCGQRDGTSARRVPGPTQKPRQLSSDTSWQQEATTATPVLGSWGWGPVTTLPRPRPLPRLGEAERGPARPCGTLGVDAQGPAVGSACPYPPTCPRLFPPHPCLLSPALSLHRGVHSSHCSLRCIFMLSVLVRVRLGCRRRGGQRGCLCM